MDKQSTAKKRQASAPPDEAKSRGAGHGAATSLDRIIHERMRLAVVSALAVNASLSFNELKRILNTTDGNLSVHARKLEDAGYIECDKFFQGRVPKTVYRLTGDGRRALTHYLNHMEALIRRVREEDHSGS